MPGEEVADEMDGAGLLDVGIDEVVVARADAARGGGVEGGTAGVEGGFGGDAFYGGDVGVFLRGGEGAPFFSDDGLLGGGLGGGERGGPG